MKARMIVSCAMLLGCMAGATQKAGAAAEGKRIAMFMGPTQDKYLGALSRSFETAASGHGMKVTVYSSPFDPALQAQQLDDAVAQKFDFFVVQIISQRAIIPVLTRVKNAGIPVALVVAPMVGNEANAQDLYQEPGSRQDGRDHRAASRRRGEDHRHHRQRFGAHHILLLA